MSTHPPLAYRADAPQQTTRVWSERLSLPTFLPAPPDRNPMFLEKRVYQGSSGKVYPLPFTDRIAEEPVDRQWQAVWIENEFLRVLVLPEIGGRIHAIQDKTNGFDLIYRQHVIKPALVGLAGPWISGGIEFNWPQHHRPATFLPVSFQIEQHADGAVTVWCGDHDPMARMKGMHGVCLHPGKAYLELKVRVYNRTRLTQTFLWWANVATRVHASYQSFFPPDVHYVADHARRSMSAYPLAQGRYYGVDYGERGRKGIPASERPAHFIPPHCRPGSAPSPPESRTPEYAPNDLGFYANIPVPTSYMCVGSNGDFFGGYDHKAQAGIVHLCNHHIAPGKKQWTWGNHEFGYAWDRNLTEKDASGEWAPYIEIMAGVYTDNQPDFSFLHPGETKSWSQYWYPIQRMGPAQHANLNAAISLRSHDRLPGLVALGVAVTGLYPRARITLSRMMAPAHPGSCRPLVRFTRNLAPDKPFLTEVKVPKGILETDLVLRVSDRHGCDIITYRPRPRAKEAIPPAATEPPAPRDITSADELYVTGLHLDQYRHATRCPTLYWREALRRDPLDARCNNALGVWHCKRGEFAVAEKHFRAAIERLTCRNANPYDGEPFYHLGLCLRYQADALLESESPMTTGTSRPQPEARNRAALGFLWNPDGKAISSVDSRTASWLSSAYAAFYKATWNHAWAAAGYHALAEVDGTRGDWGLALEHVSRALRLDSDNLRARNLKVIALRKLERASEAGAFLRETLALDPLDCWARHLRGDELKCDLQTLLDIAHDYARAGLLQEAIDLLQPAHASTSDLPDPSWGAQPLVHYTLGWLEQRRGHNRSARRHFRTAAQLPSDYCFPARLEEIAILATAMRANPSDAKAPYYLGNLLYDRRRHREAIRLWEHSANCDGAFSIVWRNLGIGYFNIHREPAKARAAYQRAFKANPADARLLYERDHLWKRLGERPAKRLRELEQHVGLVRQRDDLSVELATLYNQIRRPDKALALLSARHFQPWEGGEGAPLTQWVRAHLALGRKALNEDQAAKARDHFAAALTAPPNLGEAKHLLANQSDIHYWLGCAHAASGDAATARKHWRSAAAFKGDFQEMCVRAFSEMTYHSARAWEKLGQPAKARRQYHGLLAYAQKLGQTEAKIDYFATSLPTMLLFDDDLQQRQEIAALFLEAQARLGLGQKARAKALLAVVLERDPNHALAADLVDEIP